MRERELFRWAGSKRHLVQRVMPMVKQHLASTGGRLISLFHGSGAIERACGGAAIAADASPELLQLFEDFKRFTPEQLHAAVLDFAAKTPATMESYRAARKVTPEARAPLTSTARFIWLSSMAHSGLWRVNSSGEMNTPEDPERLAHPDRALPPLRSFRVFAYQIQRTRFVKGWQAALAHAGQGDVALCDSPYGEFDMYTADGFGDLDHVTLAESLREATTREVALIAFNAPDAKSLYPWAHVETVERSGCINSDTDERQAAAELLITAGPLRVKRAA